MKIITETKRLLIREIMLTDLEMMLAMHSDPEVHIYLGNHTITSRSKMIEAIKDLERQYAAYGVGRWAMITKDTDEFIGWTGLEFVEQEINSQSGFYDLGYRLMKKYWAQGFATESAIASIEYGFDRLKLPVINAMADKENAGSHNVLEKVGMRLEGVFDLDGVAHNWYALERSEYEERRSKD